jgi:hypothetical protein
MDQFEEIFLKEMGYPIGRHPITIKRTRAYKQTEDETVRDFQGRFENMLYQIPESHHPEGSTSCISIPMHFWHI